MMISSAYEMYVEVDLTNRIWIIGFVRQANGIGSTGFKCLVVSSSY